MLYLIPILFPNKHIYYSYVFFLKIFNIPILVSSFFLVSLLYQILFAAAFIMALFEPSEKYLKDF